MIEPDCSDAQALIQAYQRSFEGLGRDITPRLIAWGLAALQKEGVSLSHVKRSWADLTLKQRWYRVRAFLSVRALNTLAGILAAEYGRPAEQLNLLERNDGKET